MRGTISIKPKRLILAMTMVVMFGLLCAGAASAASVRHTDTAGFNWTMASASPSSNTYYVKAGNSVTVSVSYWNEIWWPGNATSSFTLEVKQAGVLISGATATWNAVPPGGSGTTTAVVAIPAGTPEGILELSTKVNATYDFFGNSFTGIDEQCNPSAMIYVDNTAPSIDSFLPKNGSTIGPNSLDSWSMTWSKSDNRDSWPTDTLKIFPDATAPAFTTAFNVQPVDFPGHDSAVGTMHIWYAPTLKVVLSSVDDAGNTGEWTNVYKFDTTCPAKVTGVTAAGLPGAVKVVWTTVADTDVDYYNIYRSRCSDSDSFSQIGTVDAQGVNPTTFFDSGFTGTDHDTYFYAVTATDMADNESGAWKTFNVTDGYVFNRSYSDVANAAPTADATAPTIIGVEPFDGKSVAAGETISAYATDNAAVAKIRFEMSADGGTSWSRIVVDATPATYSDLDGWTASTNFNDFNLVGVTSYQLRVTAYDAYGNASTPKTVTYTHDPTRPAAPTGVAVAQSGKKVKVAWNAVSNAVRYEVLRADNAGGPYASLTTNVVNNYFEDSDIFAGHTYYYVVRSIDALNKTSNDSTEASIVIAADVTAPVVNAMTPVDGKYISGGATFKARVTENFDLFKIVFEYSTDGGTTWKMLGEAREDAWDIGLDSLGDVYYANVSGSMPEGAVKVRVIAYDKSMNPSAPLVQSYIVCTKPTAPAGLVAVGGNAQTWLTWTTSSDPAFSYFTVYRSETPYGPFNSLGDTEVTFLVDSWMGGVNGQTYYYVITQTNKAGQESLYSTAVSAAWANDIIDPFLSVNAPVAGSYLKGTVVFDYDVNNNDVVGGSSVHVKTYLDNALLRTDQPALSDRVQFSVDTASIRNGKHTLMVVAIDSRGNETTKTMTIYVDNFKPVISAMSANPSSVRVGKSTVIKFKAKEGFSTYVMAALTVTKGGKVVRVIEKRVLANTAGYANSIKWDGKDSNGKAVAKGTCKVYLKLTDGAGTASANKMITVKII